MEAVLKAHGGQGRAIASCRSEAALVEVEARAPTTAHQLVLAEGPPRDWDEAFFAKTMTVGAHGFSCAASEALTPDFVKACMRWVQSE